MLRGRSQESQEHDLPPLSAPVTTRVGLFLVLTPNQVHFQVEIFWSTGTSFL